MQFWEASQERICGACCQTWHGLSAVGRWVRVKRIIKRLIIHVGVRIIEWKQGISNVRAEENWDNMSRDNSGHGRTQLFITGALNIKVIQIRFSNIDTKINI